MTRKAFGSTFLLVLLASAVAGADDQKLRVEVLGLGGVIRSYLPSGEIRKNVLSVLSIDDARKDKNLTEARIRQLHKKATDEIRTALEPYGYFNPVIDATLTHDERGWRAQYRIDPGPELQVTSLDLQLKGDGASESELVELAQEFPLKQGVVVNSSVYGAAKKELEDFAADNGYLDAAFTESRIAVDRAKYTADIVLHFDTGPRYRFGPTRFKQSFLNENLLGGYITWTEGQPLDANELLRFQGSLSDSPYFSRVEVEMRREEAIGRQVPIEVTLEPSKPRRFTFGLGYGTDTGPRVSGTAEFRRLNKRGHRAEADMKLSSIEQSLWARYYIPGPYPRTDVLSFQAGFANLDTATSKSRTALAGVSLSRLRGRWHEVLSLTEQRETYTVGLDTGTSYLLIPEANWSRVVADDRVYTTRGFRLQLDIRFAVKPVLSNGSFGQVTADGKWIRSFGKKSRSRVIARAQLGYTITNDFRILPPRVRFFSGGDQSVRGYAFNRLGSLDEEGNVIGGKIVRVVSGEYEYKFLDKWGGFSAATFVDAGNATLTFSEPLRVGAGVGLRWRSPIGTVRGDAAFALSLPGNPLRFHLTVGPDL
ncbi:MAG: autotransporter assembly complex family protein [Thermoanaerobaculia bacterium]